MKKFVLVPCLLALILGFKKQGQYSFAVAPTKTIDTNQFQSVVNSCNRAPGHLQAGPIHSYYITMRDGVRIAVDVVLPVDSAARQKFPTILLMTRYWRRPKGDGLTPDQKTLIANGYAIVTGDVRGTGASFGTWPYHRSRAETMDLAK